MYVEIEQKMQDEKLNKSSIDHRQHICPIQCDTLLRENESVLKQYNEFCSGRSVLSTIDLEKKQLRLYGSQTSIFEAEKRFLELENKLLVENIKKQSMEGICWWFEAWDATWQLYNSQITMEIEDHYKSKIFTFTLINPFGEKVLMNLSEWKEIYGKRIKPIRRSKTVEQQPSYWTLTPWDLAQFKVDINSNEYIFIRENFNETMQGLYTKFISIERIQNLRLFKQFCVSQEDFIVRYGTKDNGTMRFLYHGCPEDASERIIKGGFNRSYCGIHGCLYGRGVYFSSKAKYSNSYAIPNNKKEKRMFYSRVLIGRSMIGNSQIREPEDGYDTTTNGSHIFVCYHDSQCYPEYLITYV